MPFSYLISLLINKGYKTIDHAKYLSINNVNILKKNILSYNFIINNKDKQREIIINIEMKNNQQMVF